MASISSSTPSLACNYAVSKVVGDSKPPYLGVPKRMPIIKAQSQNSMVELEKVSKVVGDSKQPYFWVPKRMPILKAESQNSVVELEKVDKLKRASLFGLGAALVATPFSSPAFADIIGTKNLTMDTALVRPVIKVAGLGGSLSQRSRNRWLIQAASEICAENVPGMQVEYIDITGLPTINPDLLVDGKCPPEVEEVRQKILAADSLLFATTEYNYSVTPNLKNILDWGSLEPNVFDGKPAAIMSAGNEFGGGLAQFNLRQIGVRINIHFINTPNLYLRINDPPPKFDSEGNLIDQEARLTIQQILVALKKFTQKLDSSKFGPVIPTPN